MIAYLDTSAFVQLLVEERSSEACRKLCNGAEQIASSVVVRVEAAAALAQAERLGRIDHERHQRGLDRLEDLADQLIVVPLDSPAVRIAAALARTHALRGYDAVHCASAVMLNDRELVAAAGDRRLLEAWASLGIATYDLAA